jgi:hypothetical protein
MSSRGFIEFASARTGRLQEEATICNLYSITTNQAAIIALFRVINRYVGNLVANARRSAGQ